MATHPGILACTEEPSRLQSMGSRRVGYNWVTDTEWPSGFTCFLQFKREFCKENSWSEPQTVPGHVKTTLTLWSFSIFGCKEYNQSDFGVDHLVMSMCRVVSCGVGRGCVLWPEYSLEKTLFAFPLLHFILQGQTCLLLQVSLDFLLLPSNPLWWKGHLFWCDISSRWSWRSS